jgi:hypothetical protein
MGPADDNRDRTGLAMAKKWPRTLPLQFPSIRKEDLPDSRGKRRQIVFQILSDLRKLDEYSSLRIDLVAIGKSKAELRAALHRTAKKQELGLSATSDSRNVYVFHRKPGPKTS